MSPIDFAGRLMAYCAATGGSVTSWGRTEAHNAAVDGHERSFHLTWLAADVVYDGSHASAWLTIQARHVGLELINQADHDHLEPLP